MQKYYYKIYLYIQGDVLYVYPSMICYIVHIVVVIIIPIKHSFFFLLHTQNQQQCNTMLRIKWGDGQRNVTPVVLHT